MKEFYKEIHVINVSESGINATPHFSSNARNNGLYKLYIISSNGDIIYVGITSQSISTRFSQSFRAYNIKKKTGKSDLRGDSGYKWIPEYMGKSGLLKLNIYYFKKNENTISRMHLEAIEAEIAYMTRKNTGKWPVCQCEIHFHNIPESISIAYQIYNEINAL